MDYDRDSELTRNEIIDNSDTSRVDEDEREWEVSDFSSSGDSMETQWGLRGPKTTLRNTACNSFSRTE